MPSVPPTPPNGLYWRLERIENDLRDLERDYKRISETLPAVEERLKQLREALEDSRTEFRSLKVALWTGCISVTIASIVFAFTIYQVFG
jgi:hypothetical protein